MYCTSCGGKLDDSLSFCIYCGARVTPITPAPMQGAQAVSEAPVQAMPVQAVPAQAVPEASAQTTPAQAAAAQAAPVQPIQPVPVKLEGVAKNASPIERTTLLESISGDIEVPTPPTVILTRKTNGKAYRIETFPAVLGKGSAATVVIEGNPSISRVHAQINAVGAVVTLEDKGSMNGTTHNGQAIGEGRHPQLAVGDVVGLAGEEFVVSFA